MAIVTCSLSIRSSKLAVPSTKIINEILSMYRAQFLSNFINVHIDTNRAARLEATSHTYWTTLISSSSGIMPNFLRTSLVLLLSPSTESLESQNDKHVTRHKSLRIKRLEIKTYCSMCDTKSVVREPGVKSLCSAVSPTNKSPSLVNFASITRTTSPRYLPAMYFSNLKKEAIMIQRFF